MYKNKSAVLAGILLIVVLGYSPAHAISVGLTVLDDYIEVGENFGVQVWAYGEGVEEDLLAFGFDTQCDGSILAYSGYAIGSDFLDFPDPENPNNVSGMGAAFDNANLLATLYFGATGAGNGSVGVEGAYDSFFYGLFYDNEISADIAASAFITVNAAGSAPVPEPATIFLLSMGLAGVCGLKRRFQK